MYVRKREGKKKCKKKREESVRKKRESVCGGRESQIERKIE